MILSRTVGLRGVGPAVAVSALLAALLSGCDAEAVELAREIEAARGECSREGLRESDEECVRMMERYTSMGTDLVHTYLGGLRALDMALDRMPPPRFDTAGVGYAISPELRQGDPAGAGASPRLAPPRADYSYSYGPSARANESLARRSDARSSGVASAPESRRSADPAYRGAYDGYDDRYAGRRQYSDRYDRRSPEGRYGDAEYERWRDRDGRGPYRTRRDYRDGYFADSFGGFGAHAPFGLGAFAPPGPGWFAPFADWRYSSPYGPGGYAPYGTNRFAPYAYDGYGVRDRHAPGAGWSGGGYDPYDRYSGYDPYDPYARPYGDDDYGRYAPPGSAGGYDDRPPADAWGYDLSTRGDAALPVDAASPAAGDPAIEGAAERSTAPARPAPHRPGILLPPEERLRRPWLDD